MAKRHVRAMRLSSFIAAVSLGGLPGNAAAMRIDTVVRPLASVAESGRDDRATHATRGVVKAVDGGTMTVSRPRNRGDITFALAAGRHEEGVVTVGATVAVRYHDEGSTHVATAITVQRGRREQ